MSLPADAAALVAACRARPADETPRLVLADWLDDTGDPADAAWAAYLRARAAAARTPEGSRPRRWHLAAAAVHAPDVVATLAVTADEVVRAPAYYVDLLPAERLTVHPAGWTPPAELLEIIPESVMRERRVLALSGWDGPTLYLLCADPGDRASLQTMEFILNRDIVALRAAPGELDACIDAIPASETESVDSGGLMVFESRALLPPFDAGADPPATVVITAILGEAVRRGADWIEITPEPGAAAAVRFRADDEWFERDTLPHRLYPTIVARLAEMAGIPAGAAGFDGDGEVAVVVGVARATFRVLIAPLPAGPWVWAERVD